jgi:type VI secretion system secreted protein VgrG
MSLTDSALCAFSSLAPSLLLEKLWVQQWRGEERVSQPYRFEVRLATINPLFNDEALLGERAVLTLSDDKGLPHPYHGIVTEVDYLDTDTLYHYYRVVLEPRVTQLRHFRFSEIWLDKNLPELIRDVLKLADLNVEGPGISGERSDGYDFDIRLPLKDISMTQAAFTCQFEESSFAFLSRLLEYFGVYYFFEQHADGEALVLCGDWLYQPKTPSLLTYRRQDSDLEVGQGLAVARTFERKLIRQAAEVTLQDFSASKADLRLLSNASISAASLAVGASPEELLQLADSAGFVGEQGLYGEHFGSGEQGQWLAERRAQAIGCRHREFHGNGRASNLRAGYPILLAGHPRVLFNATYQVIEVHHEGYQPLPGLGQNGEMASDVATRFIALPGDVQFRTPIVTPKPSVQGLLSAIVDGDEQSSSPLLNSNGCYKVSFPFIRGEKNATRGSAWVRMATMSSGANHGMNFPLLKGTEVLISFLGGDPDRPVITGSVPNSENPNRVNASNATQSGLSTPGGHLFAMEDSPNGPMMTMGASTGCAFSLGEGDISGAHMRTDKHMQFASSSYQHEVPGVYKMSVMGGTPPEPVAAAHSSERSLNSNFKNSEKTDQERIEDLEKELEEMQDKAAEAKKEKEEKEETAGEVKSESENKIYSGEAKIVPRIMLETKLTTMALGASAGGFKGDVNLQLMNFDASLAGPKWEFSVNMFNRNFELGKYYIRALKHEKSLNKLQECGIYNLKTVTRRDQSGVLINTSALGHTITVGASSITLTPTAILIKAPTVFVDGNLSVSGDVVMDQKLKVMGNTALQNSLYVDFMVQSQAAAVVDSFTAPGMVCGPMIPPDPQLTADNVTMTALGVSMAAEKLAQEAAATLLNTTTEAAIDAVITEEAEQQAAASARFFVPA